MPATVALACLAVVSAPAWACQDGDPAKVYLAGRILTAAGDPVDGGAMVVRGGRIEAIGPRDTVAVPAGATTVDFGTAWLCPGFVDLHHHVSSGGGDINDMVAPLNQELRTLDLVRPTDEAVLRTVAGGITTTLFIPGSGTYISGFGVLLKMRHGEPLENLVLRPLGAMKVAQGFNPERQSGDLGATRMGSSEMLTRRLEQGRDYAAAWRAHEAGTGPRPERDASLEQLRLVFDKQVPVLIHTAGARDCVSTARMFQDVFDVQMVLSHGCFDGFMAAAALARRNTPVNLGPRMYQFDRYSAFQGMCIAYWSEGCTDMSINTDAPVVAAEELPLQAAMAVRLGLPYHVALQALTIAPARQIGIADRVGSLEVGKDADFLVSAGDPLDSRNPPLHVYIDGKCIVSNGKVK